MIHVCFVGYGISPPWNEGRKVVSRNIINALRKYSSLDISVISSTDGEGKMDSVMYVNTPWFTRHVLKSHYELDPILNISMLSLINFINKKNEIDLFHLLYINFPLFLHYARKLKKNVVIQFFGDPKINFLRRFRVLPEGVNAYITTSMEVEWAARLGVKGIWRVNPPIDTDVFKPISKSKAREHFNLPEDDFIALYLGNVTNLRFSPDFLRNINLRGENRKIVIFANYISSNWRRKREMFRKNNILLEEKILHTKQKVYLYNAADVFIMPFSRELKMHKHVAVIDPPITMLEAMSCGIPVIAPNVLSIPRIIKNGYNGYITPLGDFKAFNRMLSILSPEDCKELGMNARKTILHQFSFKKVAMVIEKIYEGVLNG